jgi:hypothetical protein
MISFLAFWTGVQQLRARGIRIIRLRITREQYMEYFGTAPEDDKERDPELLRLNDIPVKVGK